MSEQPSTWDKPLDALELSRLQSIAIDHAQPRDRRYVAAERIYRSHKSMEISLAQAQADVEALIDWVGSGVRHDDDCAAERDPAGKYTQEAEPVSAICDCGLSDSMQDMRPVLQEAISKRWGDSRNSEHLRGASR